MTLKQWCGKYLFYLGWQSFHALDSFAKLRGYLSTSEACHSIRVRHLW